MKIKQIGQIAIPIHNVDRALDFYANKLGLKLLFQAGQLTFFECGDVRLLLAPPEKDDQEFFGSIIYYQVDDIHQGYHSLHDKGVIFLDQPHIIAKMHGIETWMVFFKDSEGNTLALMSEVVVKEASYGTS
jgi:methylmalonyl-CoA/ethylmalonyl-CoA epimerase